MSLLRISPSGRWITTSPPPARPVENVESRFDFEREAISVLREAARDLRERLPEEDVRVRGNVVRLHRDGNAGSGEVTVAWIVTGDVMEKLRRVSVSLSEGDYATAIAAHEQFADVEVSGALYQRVTRTYLRDARGFFVHPQQTLTEREPSFGNASSTTFHEFAFQLSQPRHLTNNLTGVPLRRTLTASH